MLSYRHAFHAGNHADVLKHLVETMLLDYLNQKDKPWWYIDTHSGAGFYSLEEGFASKKAEYREGIARLWHANDLPAALARYVNLIKSFNPDGQLRFYPGSPMVAERLMRDEDRVRLFELHPADFELLEDNVCHLRKMAIVQKADGFAGLKAFLPPPPRRALVLIDPPYEVKEDYHTVEKTLKDALTRFATGTYAVWYPCLQRHDSQQLPEKLKQLPIDSWLHVALHVQHPSADGFGMHGSGMFVINPPWTLHAALQEIMPVLVEYLAIDSGADFVLEHVSR
ncbi:23S rRNA (adenine(2030)-N(6))-methyltransferase RlmJ [Burkholderiaceae bacterium DAT-1]|nr:23S rRNA (adenine(2030)-N(6))-methyltransferase RlmJ [Burkholderiaceae bacterium DAT-1]